jgi:hypothetical protein
MSLAAYFTNLKEYQNRQRRNFHDTCLVIVERSTNLNQKLDWLGQGQSIKDVFKTSFP